MFLFASLYLSYLQVFHNIQMLPLSLTNAANACPLQVLSMCPMKMLLPISPLQMLSMCLLQMLAATVSCKCCQCVPCKYCMPICLLRLLPIRLFHSCMCLTCDCCQCCCSYIFWTVSSYRASESLSLQKQVGCFNNRVVTMVTDKLARHAMAMRGLLLVLEINCVRQPMGWLPSPSYNHYTLKTLKHLDSLACMVTL